MDTTHPGRQRRSDPITGREQLLSLGQTHTRVLRHRHQRHHPSRLDKSRHRHPRRPRAGSTTEGTIRRAAIRRTTRRAAAIPITARIPIPASVAPASARDAVRHAIGSTSRNATGRITATPRSAIRRSVTRGFVTVDEVVTGSGTGTSREYLNQGGIRRGIEPTGALSPFGIGDRYEFTGQRTL
ncbi:hypothetical protein [Microbispora sp. NBC_01389]|uniref:hypothetical protein n=1 Tax=Microbispora sp. NBC_01389 TaxID=2903584 RepID=UPI0032490C39